MADFTRPPVYPDVELVKRKFENLTRKEVTTKFGVGLALIEQVCAEVLTHKAQHFSEGNAHHMLDLLERLGKCCGVIPPGA